MREVLGKLGAMVLDGRGLRFGNIKDQDGEVLDRTEGESNERNIVIDGDILWLGRRLLPGKLSGSHKDDHS